MSSTLYSSFSIGTIQVAPIITLLFQGLVGGIIIAIFTYFLKGYEDRRMLKKYALLVYLEIQDHLHLLEVMMHANKFPNEKSPARFKIKTWEEAQVYLTRIPLQDLLHLGSYYLDVQNTNYTLTMMADHEIEQGAKQSLELTQLRAKAACELLISYFDSCSKKKKHSHKKLANELFLEANNRVKGIKKGFFNQE